MRKFVSFGPALVVLGAAVALVVAVPTVIQRVVAEQTRGRVLLAQRQLDADDILMRLNEAVGRVAEAVEPSVVHIEMLSDTGRALRSSSGAGLVWDDLGHVITNAHVVTGADRIQVQFFDGRLVEATLVGADPLADVAVLKVAAGPYLVPVRRASGEKLSRGERVFAFGSPFGYKFSMSEGIVSGLGRSARAATGFAGLSNFIQHDAAVNPGNSGGPLVDVRGRLVGVNVAIATASQSEGTTEGQSAGISFAIPLATVERRVDQFISTGRAESGWLGIEFRENIAFGENEFEGRGLLVTGVVEGGGAQAAGIKSGDVITHIDNETAADDSVLRSIVGSSSPGQVVTLRVYREGEFMDVLVTLGEVPRSRKLEIARGRLAEQFGFMLRFDQRDDTVRIFIPDPESPAARSGLRNRDELLLIEGEAVKSVEQAIVAFDTAGALSNQAVDVRVRREGESDPTEVDVRLILK